MTCGVLPYELAIWMPFVEGGSGADISAGYLAEGLRRRGNKVVLQRFHHSFQWAPWLLLRVSPPAGTSIILTNTWNGFAFARAGCRLVTVDRLCVHDPTLEPYKSIPQRLFHNQIIRRYVIASAKRSDAVVAVSRYTADLYPDELGLPRPIVIPNAVDTEFFVPPNQYSFLSGVRPVRLLFVGNLTRRKGADMLAPIMRRLPSGYELYYTAGLRAKGIVDQLPNMHPLGRLGQAQMCQQYQAADLLLFPSRGEGLPRAVMESLACGTPVVAANVSSLPEAIDEHVGRLCPRDDADAFAQAVRDLTISPAALMQLSINARERAEERFSLSRMTNQFVELFHGLRPNIPSGGLRSARTAGSPA